MHSVVTLALRFCVFGLLLAASNSFAHNLWLNPSNHYPKIGETVDIGIGWGHQFRESRTDQEVKENTVEEIQALDPDGQAVSLERESAALYKLKVQKPGVYLISARVKSGFFTVTSEGRKWGTKKEVENPLKCTSYHLNAKTLIVAGGSDSNLSGLMNQPLEIVLLKDPSKLEKGASLPLKVLFEGKALGGVALKATYAGFEPARPDSPSGQNPTTTTGGAAGTKTDHGHGAVKYPVETVTDSQGLASIPLDRGGYWIVLISHKPPFPDPETCDEYMYNVALTFQAQ